MLLAARLSFYTPMPDVSTKSYVQDGLVAMWDGIENAGGGMIQMRLCGKTWLERRISQ